MDKEAAIEKVKLLKRLAASPEEHESNNAKVLADKLIERFNLLPEEYEEKEEIQAYNDDDLLFTSPIQEEWSSTLALVISRKYDCLIIEEQNLAGTGETYFKYFVYGNSEDVAICKLLYNFISSKIEESVSENCYGRGDLYISSFKEGLVNGVRINIETEDFHIKGIVKSSEEEVPKAALVSQEKKNKEDLPIKEKTQVNKKEKPLDLIAFFTGEGCGRKIHIGDKLDDALFLEEENVVEDYSWLSGLKKLLK